MVTTGRRTLSWLLGLAQTSGPEPLPPFPSQSHADLPNGQAPRMAAFTNDDTCVHDDDEDRVADTSDS